ncbi:MAG: HD domain-containing protein [Candidatus Saccharimonadales bacterium]
MEKHKEIFIDQIELTELVSPEVQKEPQQHIAAIALTLAGVAMDFARVERVPRYADSLRESDVEHSYMLSLIASELAYTLYPATLDTGLVAQYAGVHDLIELKTADVGTFNISAEDLARKEQLEHDALDELIETLPPYTGALVRAYESQQSLESRFVRAVDKLMPVLVDILGDGVRIMVEDFNVESAATLLEDHLKLNARLREKYEEFPEIIDAHALLCELFELESEEAFNLLSA